MIPWCVWPVALACLAWIAFTLADLIRAHRYANNTQEFRTDAERERHEQRVEAEFANPNEWPAMRLLLAADREMFEGAGDL